MKEIKIFLASSEELEIDRHRFGNYIRKIDEVYEKRGVRVRLIEWEDLDSSYQGRRTQDMYNDKLCDCQMCVALFHTKAGKYTLEEVNVARERFEESGFPKVYVYVKDLAQGEVSTPELEEFKSRLFESLGHYFCRYGNTDTLILQFIMQLQLVDTSYKPKIDTEDSAIRIEGRPMVSLENVPFAANNDTYCELHEEIAELQEEISEIEEELLNAPNPKKEEKLGRKRTKLFNLKEKRASLEKDLVNTAMTIARLLGKSTSERLRKAIALFESGDNKGADALLDMSDIEREAELNAGLVQAGKEAYQAAVSNIEELRLKAKNILTIHDNPSRFDEADHAYSVALDTSHKIELPHKDLIDLLAEYHNFLRIYARYDQIQSIGDEWLKLAIEEYGEEHEETAKVYNSKGKFYCDIYDFNKALYYHKKSLDIRERVLGEIHLDTAKSYNNLGTIYLSLCENDKALYFFEKSLEIKEKLLGKGHPSYSITYINIGTLYKELGKVDKALEIYKKALGLIEVKLGKNHLTTAKVYENIGMTYISLGNFEKAIEYHKIASNIYEIILGEYHPETANSYNQIGGEYLNLEDLDNALLYAKKALSIYEKIFGADHKYVIISYKNLGEIYYKQNKFDQALRWDIKYNMLCPKDIEAILRIAESYQHLGDYKESLEWYKKGLEIEPENLICLDKVNELLAKVTGLGDKKS